MRFADCLKSAANVADIFLECGPGKILGSLTKLQLPNDTKTAINSLRHSAEKTSDDLVFWNALGRLWELGEGIDLGSVGAGGRRVSLPSYAFDRQRFYIEPAGVGDSGQSSAFESTPSTRPEAGKTSNQTPVEAKPTSARVAINAVPEAPPMPNRLAVIAAKLTTILHELSGIPEQEISPNESFLDMGFDSLFLTQANLRIKKTFKVKITFRQLFDDAPTIDALARFIDEKLPADALQSELAGTQAVAPGLAAEESTTAPQPSPVSPAPQSPLALPSIPAGGEGAGSLLQQAIMLQLQASNSLMLALGQSGGQLLQPLPAQPTGD